MTRLDAIRARAEAITPNGWLNYPADLPREWHVVEYGDGTAAVYMDTPHGVTINGYPSAQAIARYCTPADADFIAHSREDVPALLGMLDAAMEVVDAARFVVRARHTAAMNTEAWIDQNLAPALDCCDATLALLRESETP